MDLRMCKHGVPHEFGLCEFCGQERTLAAEVESLRAEVTRLTHDLANERKEAESTLSFYAEKGRVVVARDGNAVQRLGASAEIAIIKAEDEAERLREEIHSHIIGNQDAQAVISRQAGMLADLRIDVERLRGELDRAKLSNAMDIAARDSAICMVKEAEAARDKYKAALEWAIKESGGGEAYLREGVAEILSAEAVQP